MLSQTSKLIFVHLDIDSKRFGYIIGHNNMIKASAIES